MHRDEVLPWFAGPATFMRAPLMDFEDIKPGMVVVSGAPYGVKDRITQRGGPGSIRQNSLVLAEGLERAGPDGVLDTRTGRRLIIPDETRLIDVGDLNVYPSDVMRTTEGIAGGVQQITKTGGFSVCLGGDHYMGYPCCLGFCRAVAETKPGDKVGYIQFDGHLDFGETTRVMGRYNSGTNARRISEIDVIVPSAMVFIGIQGPCSFEQVQTIKRMGGTIFTSEDIHDLGPAEVGKRAGELAIKDCDHIYLSFDIDVLDAGFASGTGSVTMGAVTPGALMKILDELVSFPLGGMDLVEIAPDLDASGRTSMMAAEFIFRLIAPKICDVR